MQLSKNSQILLKAMFKHSSNEFTPDDIKKLNMSFADAINAATELESHNLIFTEGSSPEIYFYMLPDGFYLAYTL